MLARVRSIPGRLNRFGWKPVANGSCLGQRKLVASCIDQAGPVANYIKVLQASFYKSAKTGLFFKSSAATSVIYFKIITLFCLVLKSANRHKQIEFN